MRSYIVLVSPSYGGAEKRFFDIFKNLRRLGTDVMLIAPSKLVQQFGRDHADQPELISAIISIPMENWSPIAFVLRFRRVLSSLPRKSSFHYPMNCLWPLHLGRGDLVSMSVTNCITVPSPFTLRHTRLWTWVSFFFARRIDVLSPAILDKMSGYRTAGKMSLTPGGTFVELPKNVNVKKAPIVVLLSRLVAKKGIDDLLDVIPQVWRLLRRRVPHDFSFKIAGYGPLEKHVVSRIEVLANDGIPIVFTGYTNAADIFPSTAVVLSMQEVTNYPSRVVAEGLVSGCAVIVRNTGDSMQFGNDIFGLAYCKAELDPAELSEKILSLFNNVISVPDFSQNIEKLARYKFSSTESVEYFYKIICTR